MRELHALAAGVGLAALVEAHDEAELDRALALGAGIVGVNARDLGTFAEDLGVSERLAARIPRAVVAVAESAVRSVDDAPPHGRGRLRRGARRRGARPQRRPGGARRERWAR